MQLKRKLRRCSLTTIAATMIFGTGMLQINTSSVHAANFTGDLTNVISATVDEDHNNIVYVNFDDKVTGKITFLENGLFRYNVDPTGEFGQYAKPRNTSHTTKMQAQSDESDFYSHPSASVADGGTAFLISSDGVTVSFDKESAKMTILNNKDQVVMQETKPLSINWNQTIQTVKDDETENFFGGGMQNGRYSHKGKSINLEIKNHYTDGDVSSPNPFYWSTNGYGVFRNTFDTGIYDFDSGHDGSVKTSHSETEFDAYYFVGSEGNVTDNAEKIITDFYKVTGNPALLPEYAYYLAHLNCYNRDGWQPSAVANSGMKLEDGNYYTEYGKAHDYKIPDGMTVESLNNEMPTYLTQNFGGVINDDTYKYSARAVIDGYVDNDIPLGWFLPNDGYGCGYGQNGYYVKRNTVNPGADLEAMNKAVDANVANLKRFVDYAGDNGVKVGLWTQSALDPLTSEKDYNYYHGYQNLRDFNKEVNDAGVIALKTDVAWVGSGYSMALNAAFLGYDTVAKAGVRPNLVTIDGWAGTQRYGGIWSGDQDGGQWEYIRFHIPTYIGQALSGNPNIGSDMNGIWGSDPIIQHRDTQWKVFTQLMLDMDGWADEAKKPYYHGDPYTAMNRMYLKLKAELMPYLYSEGIKATEGLPSIRAMFLEYPDDPNLYGAMTQYQYMYGSNFLVAPIYEDTHADAEGNDVRNNIYLPDENQVWIDYFTGKQYKGGQILNNFDAPIWKLPLFVKNGAIVPMYEENNNAQAITSTNEKGLDKTKRVVEFWPEGESSYLLNEDDGITLKYATNGEDRDTIDYGGRVTTEFTSSVVDDTATLIAKPSQGTYDGYDSNRKTTFVVNVLEKPTSIEAMNGADVLNIEEVSTLEEFTAAAKDDNRTVYFYNEKPNLNKYSNDDETFKDTEIITTPKLFVKFARTDVTAQEQKLVVHGFNNTAAFDKDAENENLAVPANFHSVEEEKTAYTITVAWDAVDTATSYDVEVDGNIFTSGVDRDGTPYLNLLHKNLEYASTHNYRVRARNADGYSAWSEVLSVETLPDPYRNIPEDFTLSYNNRLASGYNLNLLTNHNTIENWFTNYDNATEMGKTKIFTFDFKENYKMDRVEVYAVGDQKYYNKKPASVTVKRSLDSLNWDTMYEQYEIDWKDNVGTIDLQGKPMRYLSITVDTPTNTYIAMSELMPHKVEGSISLPVGSNNGKPTFDEDSMTQIHAYSGAYEGSTTWGQISDADINMNGVYDVYDMSYVLFRMDGGTQKYGSLFGNLLLLPERKNVKAGETFKINMLGLNMRSVNALGGVFEYDPEQYEFVELIKGDILSDMDDYSVDQNRGDGTAFLSIALMNRGDKPLVQGTQQVGSIIMRAKKDGPAYTPNNAMIISPSLVTYPQNSVKITDVNTMSGVVPDHPLEDGEEVTISMNSSNQDEFKVGDFVQFGATVTPYGATNRNYYVESDNPEIAEVVRIEMNGSFIYYLRGVGSGIANITVISAGNPDFTATMQVHVTDIRDIIHPTIDKAEALINGGKEELMTSSSWAVFDQAYQNALELMKDYDAAEAALQAAAADLQTAIDGLTVKVSDEIFTMLQSKYAESKALEDEYTTEEFANMQAILTNVEQLFAKGQNDISEKEASNAILDMTAEQVNLSKVDTLSVLRKNLSDVIHLAEAVLDNENIANLRPEQVQGFKDAIANGKLLLETESKDKESITNAIRAISEAEQKLWEIVDKMLLEDAIARAEEMIATDEFEPNSVNALIASIENAKQVIKNDNATTQEVTGAYKDLVDKIGSLQAKANKEALYVQLAISEEVLANKDNYVGKTIEGLDVLRDQALEIINNESATQAEVDQMTTELTQANMKARLKADKENLKKTVQYARDLDFTLYTEESAAPLLDALKKADALIQDEEAFQEDVDLMVHEIETLIDKLELEQRDPIVNPPIDEKPDDVVQPDNRPGGNNKPVINRVVNKGVQAGAATGDTTNSAGTMLLLLLAGSALIGLKKRSSDHNK